MRCLGEPRHLSADRLWRAGHADEVEFAQAVLRGFILRASHHRIGQFIRLIIGFGNQRRLAAAAVTIRDDFDAGAHAAIVISADQDCLC